MLAHMADLSGGPPVSTAKGFNADNSLQGSNENKAEESPMKSKERAQGTMKLNTPKNKEQLASPLPLVFFLSLLWLGLVCLFLPSANFVH